MPVPVDDLPFPGIEAERLYAPARSVVPHKQGLRDGLHPPGRVRALFGRKLRQILPDGGIAVEAALRRRAGGVKVPQVAMENRKLPARLASGLRRAVVAGALDEVEELVDMPVQVQQGAALGARLQQLRHGKGLGRQVPLHDVGELDAGRLVRPVRAAFEQKGPPVGLDHHLGRPPVPRLQRPDPVDDPDIVVAQNPNQLFRRKMRTTPDHTPIISTDTRRRFAAAATLPP